METLKPIADRLATVLEELTALAQVGPATAPLLTAAGIEAGDIEERRVSHEQLLEAGVNPGVAARIRREHSLPWSLDGGGEDLDRRAEQVRGLQDGEREWVAKSAADWTESTGGTETTEEEPAESGWERRPWPNEPPADAAFEAEAQWRERSPPTPTAEIPELDAESVEKLAEAGITSVGRLRTCDPERVADSLDVPESTVRRWRDAARKVD
ncbi:MAG: helix-hairpin-helix domain-containing protein [Halodesulfurarchaeum sp.]